MCSADLTGAVHQCLRSVQACKLLLTVSDLAGTLFPAALHQFLHAGGGGNPSAWLSTCLGFKLRYTLRAPEIRQRTA